MDPILGKDAARSLLLGAVSGFFAVALGAFGAHALAPRLVGKSAQVWQTAVTYQAVHALALLALAGLQAAGVPGRALAGASVAFFAGVCLFSGSLYALALGGPRWLGPVTPLGGLSLLLGWGLVAAAACGRS